MPQKNKVKGSNLERQVTNDLKIKYPFVKTSRNSSRLMDDCKIDLTGLPLNIQCKAGYNSPRLKYDSLYKEMKELIKKNFAPDDPIHNYPYILINKLNREKGGNKQQPEMNQVTMTYDFFLYLILKND